MHDNHPPTAAMATTRLAILYGMVLSYAAGLYVTEQRLHHDLMSSAYNKDIIPMKNKSAVEVKIGISLLAIKSFKDDVLTLDTWVDLEWIDDRLVWNPEDYDGIHTTRMPTESLWLPDVTLYNRELTDHGTAPSHVNNARLRANGEVFITTPRRLSTYCPNRIETFDASSGETTCSMKFGSWLYDGFSLDLKNSSKKADMSWYVDNKDWEVTNNTIRRNVVYYSCCPEPYPDVSFTLYLKRKYHELSMNGSIRNNLFLNYLDAIVIYILTILYAM